ncbi:hypothetical protein G7Y89_g6517 [Cudoniella acicularis]|uniref:Transmembrane protein n=1 Tax=Cudoniella acicularis TaxID=354080 RepID=A0A8H4RMI9_9HELO|nr:hypothetical protein G7Y89_g6517 [Cudoniella acicularis]
MVAAEEEEDSDTPHFANSPHIAIVIVIAIVIMITIVTMISDHRPLVSLKTKKWTTKTRAKALKATTSKFRAPVTWQVDSNDYHDIDDRNNSNDHESASHHVTLYLQNFITQRTIEAQPVTPAQIPSPNQQTLKLT